MTRFTLVEPESRNGVTIWSTFDCARCGRKVYQIIEDVLERDGQHFHSLCSRIVKFKESNKESLDAKHPPA